MNKNNFLGRDNITKLYKQTISNTNLDGLPKQSKTIVVDMLTNKMKEVYKSIDFTKVNKKNEPKILNQFNTICVEQTSNNIKSSDMFNGEDNQVSRMKFQRDFNSSPDRKVQFVERPSSNNQQYINNKQSELPGLNNYQNQPDELGQFFSSSSISGQMNEDNFVLPMPQKLEQMTKDRQMENQSLNQRPSTPDFLKPIETQEKKDNFMNNQQPNFQQNNQQKGRAQ